MLLAPEASSQPLFKRAGPLITLRIGVYADPGYQQSGLYAAVRAAAPGHQDRPVRHRGAGQLLAGAAGRAEVGPRPGRHPGGSGRRHRGGDRAAGRRFRAAEHAGRGVRRHQRVRGRLAALGGAAGDEPGGHDLRARRGDRPDRGLLPDQPARRGGPADQPGGPGPGLVDLARLPEVRAALRRRASRTARRSPTPRPACTAPWPPRRPSSTTARRAAWPCAGNPAIKAAWDTAVQASHDGLSAGLAPQTAAWDRGVTRGAFATTMCPAWMLRQIAALAGPLGSGGWNVTAGPRRGRQLRWLLPGPAESGPPSAGRVRPGLVPDRGAGGCRPVPHPG